MRSVFAGGEIEHQDSDGSEFMGKQVCLELGNPNGPALPDLDRALGASGHTYVGLVPWVKILNHCLQ